MAIFFYYFRQHYYLFSGNIYGTINIILYMKGEVMDFLLNIFHSFEFESILKILLGGFLAGIIGLERGRKKRPAGLKA